MADRAASSGRKLLLLGALVVAGSVFAFLALGDIGENLIYYWSPTELVEAGPKAHDAAVRLGGLVVADSVVRGAGLALDFRVTDGRTEVPVHAETVPPAMFREGIGVVLEGRLRQDGVFDTQRLLVKHDNEYRAPDTPDERSVEELIETLQISPTDT